MTPTDSTSLKQIQSQDEKAFETLTERYETQLWTHTLRTVRNEAAADDLIQELFLRVWTRAGQWQGQGVKGCYIVSLPTWPSITSGPSAAAENRRWRYRPRMITMR